MPGPVLELGHGLFGLPQHFPDIDAWRERLVPAAIRVMERGPRSRQWLAAELHAELCDEAALPGWLTPWHLGSLLHRSGKVRSLGHMRFALGSKGRPRLILRDELVRILRARGGPMMRGELLADLRQRTGARPSTVDLLLRAAPFMRLDRRCYGLLDRDLPGPRKARAQAGDHVAALLEQRGRGLAAIPLQAALAGRSPVYARWTPEMCLSALRGDPRFRQSVSGAVGLSSWEDVRVPSREDLLRAALDKGGGRVRVAAMVRRIVAVYGEPPGKGWRWNMVAKAGARVKNGWIERRTEEGSGA
jgi:hypothetical protein